MLIYTVLILLVVYREWLHGHVLSLCDRELINSMSDLISVHGVKCFSQFLIVLSKEHCYEQFITRVIFSFAIFKNIHIISEFLITDKSAFKLLECHVVAKESKLVYEEMKQCTNKTSTASCFETLLKTETFEFHLAVLRFLATTDHTDVLKTMIQSILDMDIPISIIIQALPDKISTPLQSVIASLQQKDSSYINPSIALADIKNLQLKPREVDCSNEQCDKERDFSDIIRNHRNSRPTHKELAKFVIPYCSSQWRILGDLLEVPSYIFDNIQSNFNHVEICCREMLHTWLRRSDSVSWENLLTALRSPVFKFHHPHLKDKLSFPHYPQSSHLGVYEKSLRSKYTSQRTSSCGDWPPKPHQHFIDLPLARVPKEISKPKFDNQFLQYHEEKDYEIEKLTSYKQIFQCEGSDGCRVIVIEGNPGSGKTTLTYKLCKDWAEGSILQHISHLILLVLRDNRVNSANTLDEIIQIDTGRENANHINQDLISLDGKNVMVWLEGWDELAHNKRQESLFSDLILCRILTQATVVITTRPAAYETIPQNSIMHKIEIFQFTQTLSQKYIDCSFAENDVKMQFKDEMSRVPSLQTLTYNPMSLAILIRVFSYSYKLPETITEVYKKFLLMSLRRYNIKTFNDTKTLTSLYKLPEELNKILNGLEQLSYMLLWEDKLVFSDELVSEMVFQGDAVPLEFDGMGLFEVHDTEYDIGVIKNYNFLHKTIQELLAALYLSKLESTQQEKEMKSLFGNIKFEMVWLFYIGLTKFELVSVSNVFPGVKPESTQSFQRELKVYTDYQSFDEAFYGSIYHCKHLIELTVSPEFFIVLILCCYEAQCPNLCNEFINHFFSTDACYIDVPFSAATQQTMIALSYFVSHSNKNCALQIAPVFSGLTLLLTYLTNPNKVRGRLWRLMYDVQPGDFSNLLTLVQTQCYLQSLTLPFSSFTDSEFIELCECLKYNKTLLKLDLAYCNITKERLMVLRNMLQVNTKIQYLALQGNEFSTSDLIDFMKSLLSTSTLQELRVSVNKYRQEVKDCITTINANRSKVGVNSKLNVVPMKR